MEGKGLEEAFETYELNQSFWNLRAKSKLPHASTQKVLKHPVKYPKLINASNGCLDTNWGGLKAKSDGESANKFSGSHQ